MSDHIPAAGKKRIVLTSADLLAALLHLADFDSIHAQCFSEGEPEKLRAKLLDALGGTSGNLEVIRWRSCEDRPEECELGPCDRQILLLLENRNAIPGHCLPGDDRSWIVSTGGWPLSPVIAWAEMPRGPG